MVGMKIYGCEAHGAMNVEVRFANRSRGLAFASDTHTVETSRVE
jgi:hypothetical protein